MHGYNKSTLCGRRPWKMYRQYHSQGFLKREASVPISPSDHQLSTHPCHSIKRSVRTWMNEIHTASPVFNFLKPQFHIEVENTHYGNNCYITYYHCLFISAPEDLRQSVKRVWSIKKHNCHWTCPPHFSEYHLRTKTVLLCNYLLSLKQQ